LNKGRKFYPEVKAKRFMKLKELHLESHEVVDKSGSYGLIRCCLGGPVRCAPLLVTTAALLLLSTTPVRSAQSEGKRGVPSHIPPKRSSQIQDGLGGVNTSLPREPYIPWNRWWWTGMFDAGIKWARIGQYEDTSDITGWDWIEQKRGEFSSLPELDDYVDSLLDNGAKVQLQLLYGNPMYTSPAGRLPESITPSPASVHNRDLNLYSVFWPPKTPEQIAAFVR